jgi:hypothetical protein
MHTKKPFGILLVAVKHPYYGRMAYNFAASVRAVDFNFPVSVLWNGNALNHLTEDQLRVFDQLIEIQETGLCAKLSVAEHSPYEITLYSDVDACWLPKRHPMDLFNAHGDTEFLVITEGWKGLNADTPDYAHDYPLWADLEAIKAAYKLTAPKLYQCRSEAMIFKSTKRVKRMFALASKIYKSPKIKVRVFADQLPDEFALNIALAVDGFEIKPELWSPSYWAPFHGLRLPVPGKLYADWFMLSAGGNRVDTQTKNIYDNICKVAVKKLGQQYLFPLMQKRNFLLERRAL